MYKYIKMFNVYKEAHSQLVSNALSQVHRHENEENEEERRGEECYFHDDSESNKRKKSEWEGSTSEDEKKTELSFRVVHKSKILHS